jgi:hypothetical protein
MEITVRSLWTIIHGMGFGALYLLAGSGAVIEVYRSTTSKREVANERFVRWYFITMVACAWSAVLSGTFIVYPWYRAAVPPGTSDLAAYPQKFLLAHPATSAWHSLGMEWKEHVAWFTPIAITMVAYVFIKYANDLRKHRYIRTAVLYFTAASFFAAGVAGFFGAMINKYAPIQGGQTIQLSHGESK